MSTTHETAHSDGTRQWWLGEDGQVKGPYAAPFVVVAMKTGKLPPNALACLVGTQEWRAVADWPDFRPILKLSPPPLPIEHRPPASVVYAGFWDRVRAIFLDGLILFAVTEIVSRAWGEFFGDFRTNASAYDVFVLMAGWMYFAAFESSDFQASLGKKAMGLKVTDLAGRRISFGRATIRYFSKSLSTFVFLAGWIMAAFTPQKQALHDILASCLVVYREPLPGLQAFQKSQTA
jgi:uncharacterized RDD family membrane protein YckC